MPLPFLSPRSAAITRIALKQRQATSALQELGRLNQAHDAQRNRLQALALRGQALQRARSTQPAPVFSGARSTHLRIAARALDLRALSQLSRGQLGFLPGSDRYLRKFDGILRRAPAASHPALLKRMDQIIAKAIQRGAKEFGPPAPTMPISPIPSPARRR